MPFDGNAWKDSKMVSYIEMLDTIKQQYPDFAAHKSMPNEVSKVYGVPGFKGRVGFITSMSQNFCSSCNRVRLTADGNLKVLRNI